MRSRRLAYGVVGGMATAVVLGLAQGPIPLSGNTTPAAQPAAGPVLLARAVLPADTFAEGPRSGAAITPATNNGRTSPFDRQPVQGFSGILNNGDGTFSMLSDNGYGAKGNSADFNLRVYTVRPNWKTKAGGAGGVDVVSFIELSDPDRLVPFPIVNQNTAGRVLTGADFDLESVRRTVDGTLWFGEELGPYLLHTDAKGKLLDAPIPLPIPGQLEWWMLSGGQRFVRSPDHPDFVSLPDQDARNRASNLPSSRGFEGMALSADGSKLYPMLEGPLRADENRTRLLVSEFDLAARRYTGAIWYYRLESPAHNIGDMTAINATQFLVIERDNNEGAAAAFKKVFLVDMARQDQGYAYKTEVVDLLAIADPDGISGSDARAVRLGNPFGMPFVTIESVLMLDPQTMVIVNDNNYPFSNGRRPGSPDDNEFIQIRLPQPLNVTSYR